MAAPDPISDAEFTALLKDIPVIDQEETLAVAVSGGPDSMALAWLLSRWAQQHNKQIIALSVDHGLRAESAKEVTQVQDWIADWPHVTHHILTWDGDKPESKIMEEARAARYDLMQSHLKNASVRFLFLAHHMDDQAETFLIRLAKGSGLDGLSAMKLLQERGQDLTLVRPLLNERKDRLLSTCIENEIPYIEDPSNENTQYLRPRLRQARAILEEEGLSAKRLATTAQRLRKARTALEEITERAFKDTLQEESKDALQFDLKALRSWPDEIILRVILKSLKVIGSSSDYGPRLEKVERLSEIIAKASEKGKETLGGCIFTFDPNSAILKVEQEKR